jgi:hypothetical protein
MTQSSVPLDMGNFNGLPHEIENIPLVLWVGHSLTELPCENVLRMN